MFRTSNRTLRLFKLLKIIFYPILIDNMFSIWVRQHALLLFIRNCVETLSIHFIFCMLQLELLHHQLIKLIL